MLSSIGRTAIKRLASPAATTSLHRIAVSRFVVNTLKSNHAFVRSFATPGRPKSSATTAKRAATKKPAGKQAKSTKSKSIKSKSIKSKSTTSKSTKSKTTKRKAAPKPKPATQRKRTPLTPEKQAIMERRELKKTALFTDPKRPSTSAWPVFVGEQTKQKAGDRATLKSRMEQLSQAFKALPASELQRLTAVAEQNKLTYEAEYKAWVESHTPLQMDRAMKARLILKKKHNYPVGFIKPIHDSRIPKRPLNAFNLFTKTRWASGDYANLTMVEGVKAICREWKDLPETERQALADRAKPELEHYEKQVQSVLNRKVNRKPSPEP
ncbi:hypothetical protein F4818DRAFT_401247 [Hypoxylon cercidicola]|nr:hypothetical protein F4818DRAFT_401247 [Hypoxylon cercidicola]